MDRIFAIGSEPRTIAEKLMRLDWPLLALTAMIAGIGVVSLYSVAGGSFNPWAERHAVRYVACMAMVLVVAMLPLRLWLGLAYPAYFLALGLLALVPIFGSEAMGARRWLAIAGTTIQPSELMKVALGLMLARYYQWLPPERVSQPLWVLLPLLAIAAPVALTLKQPDLGTAVLFAIVGLGLMFLAGVSALYFLAGSGLAIAAVPLVWSRLHDYQRRRIEIFLDPDKDPLGAGYHISQSKIALGSGGASGKGYMQGTQSQLDFLPEKHTDFIFTMFAEEWGFVGAAVLLGLYVALLLMVFRMSLTCSHQFGRIVIASAGLVLFTYCFINVAMVTGLIPVVGVPLPLVSYGGTAMTTMMFGLGLALCAHVNRSENIRRVDMGWL